MCGIAAAQAADAARPVPDAALSAWRDADQDDLPPTPAWRQALKRCAFWLREG
ncbi:hypothetical protein SAMN04488238_102477 [Roseicitreum antarcticum]|uniref:Uncharacterized protein n=1 Tax=Roseicitreum antarcticum TaxID=564137 RepID=A0A1H2US82_9RHOB|nr:hypothetical protein SAMN04488238_102477 [Roseicitreum antarcticum]